MMNQPDQSKIYRNPFLLAAAGGIIAGVIGGSAYYLGTTSIPPTSAPAAIVSTATPTVQAPKTDLKIKGNKNSMIYHLPSCASYDKISDRNVVWFRTKEEAESAGYRMARNCG